MKEEKARLEDIAKPEPVQRRKQRLYFRREEIIPDKWYGVCYGRDLDYENGRHDA
jgi:hypothetical protein